jgi:hypothetical protein
MCYKKIFFFIFCNGVAKLEIAFNANQFSSQLIAFAFVNNVR